MLPNAPPVEILTGTVTLTVFSLFLFGLLLPPTVATGNRVSVCFSFSFFFPATAFVLLLRCDHWTFFPFSFCRDELLWTFWASLLHEYKLLDEMLKRHFSPDMRFLPLSRIWSDRGILQLLSSKCMVLSALFSTGSLVVWEGLRTIMRNTLNILGRTHADMNLVKAVLLLLLFLGSTSAILCFGFPYASYYSCIQEDNRSSPILACKILSPFYWVASRRAWIYISLVCRIPVGLLKILCQIWCIFMLCNFFSK